MTRYCFILTLWLQMLVAIASAQTEVQNYQFQHFSTPHGLPNNKVHRIMQDHEGFVWVGTYYGLFRYDGYEVKPYKSNLSTPDLLPHNNVLAICHDSRHRLWIGTQNGLCVLDNLTGEMRRLRLEGKPRQRIHDIVQMRDGTIYIGSVRGLFRYDEESQQLVEIAGKDYTGESISGANIQDIKEDQYGELLISTWTQGLYRYQPQSRHIIHYDVQPDNKNIDIRLQRLLIDSQNRVWLTTFNDGLLRLHFSKDRQSLQYEQFRHDPEKPTSLSSNHLRGICENHIDHTIWIGSVVGYSTMKVDAIDRPQFVNHTTAKDLSMAVPAEVNDIICDHEGQIWMATETDGIYYTNPFGSQFDVYRPSQTGLWTTNNVNRFLADQNGDYWISTGFGVIYHGRKGDREVMQDVIANGIFESKRQKSVLIAVRDKGVAVCREGEVLERIGKGDGDYLPSNNVYSFCEDQQGNWWFGTFQGLGVRYADGRAYRYESSNTAHAMLGTEIDQITLDGNGSLWLSTSSQGVIRISGRLSDPNAWELRQYSPAVGTLPGSTVFFVFCDNNGRIWAGLEGYGLCLYDEARDAFQSVHEHYNLPGDMANTMQQDDFGNLWLGTNQGLASLTLSGDSLTGMRIFTKYDGLPDNFFNALASGKHFDTLFFGCGQGLVRFHATDHWTRQSEVACVLTKISIDGRPLNDFEREESQRLTDGSSEHATTLRLPAHCNSLEIGFATLTYKMPQQNRYAYRLVGFDDNWMMVDATHREANYNNLSPGEYTFEVKGTNENGDWSEVRRLHITVLAPWWKMWWAWIIYIIAFVLAAIIVYEQVRYRLSMREELRLRQMETEKIEELNHAKLQFFANITHELMTPLTIISASLDEMREEMGSLPLISTMGNNVQRLMRLLQQILEFRKAETGNLKLRVARADMAQFLQQKVESFTPLIHKRQLHVSCVCQDSIMTGYFDTDKLDKILYNLLSNAAKYTDTGGAILLNLNYTDASRSHVDIIIKDTGRGISTEQQKTLFSRFYDGDYRQCHTIGTGIGLSLVHDLVQLHRGTIRVESEEGKGTTFTITLPFTAEAYDREQIIEIEDGLQANAALVDGQSLLPESAETVAEGEGEERPTLLLVEDNDELLSVMTQLLGHQYHVLEATNGVEALEMLRSEEVDLVVTDVIMPEMDGVELTRRIKQDIDICHIPIIMLTAKRADEDRDTAYANGADAYLTKPFSLPALQARIKSLIRTRQHAADDFRHQVNIDTDRLNLTDMDEQFLSRAVDCVNRHMGDSSFDVLQFANEMGASRSSLYKKLRSLTDLNPTAFVRNIRLKAACQVIRQNPSVRINELAYSVGFNDPKYFSICFKKEFGVHPTEYCSRVAQEEERGPSQPPLKGGD